MVSQGIHRAQFSFFKVPWLLGGNGLWLYRAVLRATEGEASTDYCSGQSRGGSAPGPGGLHPSHCTHHAALWAQRDPVTLA